MLRTLSMLLYIGSWHAASSFCIGASRNAQTVSMRGLLQRGGCLAPATTELQATTTAATFNAVNSNTTKNPLALLFSTIRTFFLSLIRMFTGKMIERTDSELKQGIAHFYDESSQIWLDVWGEHMHHGYYSSPTYNDHHQAQIDMIDRTLNWAYGNDNTSGSSSYASSSSSSSSFVRPKTMLDVGCGVGGSSRHIARKWGLQRTKGVSLSPFQIGRAKELTAAQGLSGICEFAVEDAMKMSSVTSSSSSSSSSPSLSTSSIPRKNYSISKPLKSSPSPPITQKNYAISKPLKSSSSISPSPSSSSSSSSSGYDLVWSMESGEHMPDKKQFVHELAAATAPGGRVIVVTWCHRELTPDRPVLSSEEERLLARICDAYYLPAWAPASDYVTAMTNEGLQDVRQTDWSEHIAPFWRAVFLSALGGPFPRNLLRLLRSGPTTVKGALATLWMLRGFQKGAIKFALITATKKP